LAARGSTVAQIASGGAATNPSVGNGGTQYIGFGERYLPSSTGGFEAVLGDNTTIAGCGVSYWMPIHRQGGVPARIHDRENA